MCIQISVFIVFSFFVRQKCWEYPNKHKSLSVFRYRSYSLTWAWPTTHDSIFVTKDTTDSMLLRQFVQRSNCQPERCLESRSNKPKHCRLQVQSFEASWNENLMCSKCNNEKSTYFIATYHFQLLKWWQNSDFKSREPDICSKYGIEGMHVT